MRHAEGIQDNDAKSDHQMSFVINLESFIINLESFVINLEDTSDEEDI